MLRCLIGYAMKIGIIGATGFIGSHLCDVYSNHRENQISSWNRVMHGSFLSMKDRIRFIESTNFDLIYQLAWTPIENPSYRQDVHNDDFKLATLDLVMRCLSKGIRVIVMGTHLSETNVSTDRYFAAKSSLGKHLAEINSPLVTLVRPTFVFSIDHHRPHLFRSFIEMIQRGDKAQDFVLTSPQQEIDLIHVKDVAEVLFEVGQGSTVSHDFIVCSGFTISVEHAITRLHHLLVGSSPGVKRPPFRPTNFSPGNHYEIRRRHTLSFFGLDKF